MADNNAIILVELDLDKNTIRKVEKQASDGLSNVGNKSGKKLSEGVASGFSSSSGAIRSSIGSLTTIFAAAAASIGAAFTLRESIDAAQRQDDAINKLNASLQRIGEFSQQTSKNIQDYAASLQAVTKFGDEAILEQVAFAQSLGATADQSKEIVRVAADLSAALGINLSAATRNITKTLGGLKGELGEVIPELGRLTKEQLQSGAAIDILSQKFSGFAQKDAASFSGSLQGLKNSFGDLLEEIGFFITRSESSVNIFGALKEAAAGAGAAIRDFRLQFQQSTSSEAEERINSLKVEIIDLEQTIIKANKNPILADQTNILITQKRIQELNEEIDRLSVKREELAVKEQAQEAQNTKSSEAIQKQTGLLALNNEQLQQRLGLIGLTQSEQLEEKFNQENEILRASLEKQIITEEEFNNRRLEVLNNFEAQKALIEDAARQKRIETSILDEENTFFSLERLKEAFQANARSTIATYSDIAKASQSILARGIGNAFQGIGTALRNGQSGFDAFKDGVQQTLSQIVSSIGDSFIGTGAGLLIPGTPLFNPAGGAGLIAAGAGLKVLAGFLGASGASQAGGASSSPVGGSFSSERDELTSEDQLRESGPTINLTVEGSIFDAQETGTRLVTLINDAFDRDGAVVNRNFA